MKGIRHTLHTCTALAVVLIAGALGAGTARAATDSQVGAMLAQLAVRYNQQLPQMTGDAVRLDHVIGGPGRDFTYIYTYTKAFPSAKVRQAFGVIAESMLTHGGCSKPQMIPLFRMGITLHFVVNGSDGKMIKTFAMTPQSCGITPS